MTRSNVVAVISFALVFAAGFFVGQLGWGGAGKMNQDGAGVSLTSQLELTPDQQQKVKEIWSKQLSLTSPAAVAERWDKAEKFRDEAVKKLLTPQQLPEYEKIAERHRQQAASFAKDLAQEQAAAEAQTRSLLTPQQREKFDKLVAERGVGSTRALVIPAGVPVSDVHALPATLPKDAQAR